MYGLLPRQLSQQNGGQLLLRLPVVFLRLFFQVPDLQDLHLLD